MAEGFGLLNQRAHKCTMGSNPIFSEVYDHKTFGGCTSIGRMYALQA